MIPDPDFLCFEDFHIALDLPITTEYYGWWDFEHWMLCEFSAADQAISEALRLE